MLKQDLKNRNLPKLLSREEMVEIIQREEYGYLPQNDFDIAVSNEKQMEHPFLSGNVCLSSVDLTLTNLNGSHTFPIHRILHCDSKKHPVILWIRFGKDDLDRGFPVEEIAKSEYDIITYCYNDITTDDGDFTTGIAPLVFPSGRKNGTDCGKIAIWAFANMRVLDYVLTLPNVDDKNIAILGHSRLGKTALYTGMMDERFSFVLSNNAGCAGDAIARGGSGLPNSNGDFDIEKRFRGETLEIITRAFPFWFCENFLKHVKQGFGKDFDQHYVLASIAPRKVCVNASEQDYWADQKSEQLCCVAAAEAWVNHELYGIEDCDHYLTGGEKLLKGNVGFFMSPTVHSLSAHAWNGFMEFMRIHKYI